MTSGAGQTKRTNARRPALDLRVAPRAQRGAGLRRRIREFAKGALGAESDLAEFTAAVGEAFANAVEHGHSGSVIQVHCRIDSNKIVATIIDSGGGFSDSVPARFDLPQADADRGRGLSLMRHFTDIFAVRSIAGGGTAVVLGRYLRK